LEELNQITVLFLIAQTKGSFHWKKRQATEWELTTEDCDDRPAKRLYRR
jgi:hypothetical protein